MNKECQPQLRCCPFHRLQEIIDRVEIPCDAPGVPDVSPSTRLLIEAVAKDFVGRLNLGHCVLAKRVHRESSSGLSTKDHLTFTSLPFPDNSNETKSL